LVSLIGTGLEVGEFGILLFIHSGLTRIGKVIGGSPDRGIGITGVSALLDRVRRLADLRVSLLTLLDGLEVSHCAIMLPEYLV